MTKSRNGNLHRIGGRFVSRQMTDLINKLAATRGISQKEYIKENTDSLVRLNKGAGSFEFQSNIENIEKRFLAYNKKGYDFYDVNTGKKLDYGKVIEQVTKFATSRRNEQLINAKINYMINLGKGSIALDFKELKKFNSLLDKYDADKDGSLREYMEENDVEDIEFFLYEDRE